MNKRRWITLFGAAGLFLLPWAGRGAGASCGLPLPKSTFWISSVYGLRLHPLARVRRMHWGIDLACPKGTPVHAVKGGVVAFAGRWGCYGKVLMVRHPGDVITLYAHLSQIPPGLRPGVIVRAGEVIALSGASGCVTGPHLHFEWRLAEKPVNPTSACADLVPVEAVKEVKTWHRS